MTDQTQQLVKEFDYLYKKVLDRLKTIELTIPILGERLIQIIYEQRLDAEDKLTKQLEKISQSLPKTGGDFDDLLQGIRVDLTQRCNYNKQFKTSFYTELEETNSAMKTIHHQIKTMIPEVEKVDKEIKIQYDKMEKSKEKYYKSCKEYEELVLSVQGAEWNKEITPDAKDKLLQRVNNASYLRQESQAQYNQAVQNYNQSLININTLYQLFNNQLKQISQDQFGSFKDLAQKMLVYEISRQRNLQYDTESFFKEVEKYQSPVDVKLVPADHKLSLNLVCSRQFIVMAETQKYNSFLTDISKQISLSSKLLSYNKPKLDPVRESSDIEQLLNDPKFCSSIMEIVQDMIRVGHNKTVPLDTIKEEQIDVQENKTQEQNDQVIDPLHKPKQNPQKKKTQNNLFNQLFTQFSSVPVDQLNQLLGLCKLMVEQSLGEQVHQFKEIKYELTVPQFQEMQQQKHFRELSVKILEQFRLVGCVCLSKLGFKQMVLLSDSMLKDMRQDVPLIKRTLMMLVTIHKVQESQKFFLSDGLMTNELWSQPDLWQALIFTAVDEEFSKYSFQGSQVYDREQMFKDKSTIFNAMFALLVNMISFKLEKHMIRSIIAKCSITYGLYELQTNELLAFVDNDGKLDQSRLINSTSVLQSLQSSKTEGADGKKIIMFNQQPHKKTTSLQSTEYSQPSSQPQISISPQEQQQLLTDQNQPKSKQVQQPTLFKGQTSQTLSKTNTEGNQFIPFDTVDSKLEKEKDKKITYKQHPLERKK